MGSTCHLIVIVSLLMLFSSIHAHPSNIHKERDTEINGDSATDHGAKSHGMNANPTTDHGLKSRRMNDDSVNEGRPRNAPIAFSAVCTKTLEYLPGSPVIFDNVISNEGGFYVNNTGQFVCTDNSVYVFSWAMSAHRIGDLPDARLITSLSMALTEVKYGPKTNFRRGNFRTTASEMSTIVECVAASAVTVKINQWDEENSQVLLNEELSSFSGYKLGDPQIVVGFAAELSEETNKFPGDNIRFDRVLKNYGNHFNGVTGQFLCPDNLTYVFSVSAQTQDPTTPWSVSRLMMEGEEVLLGPVTYIATADHDSGSASITAVTKCQHGQFVYVESQQAHDFPYNSYAPRLTGFMGFRLYGSEEEEASGVAFMAVLDGNLTSPQPDTPIPLRRVITNIGGAYDGPSSAFVCPDDKLYMFSFSTLTTESTESGIYMDNELIRWNRNNGISQGSTSGSATASVIVRCVPNSRVHPRHVSMGGRTYVENHCSMSGYKLPGQHM